MLEATRRCAGCDLFLKGIQRKFEKVFSANSKYSLIESFLKNYSMTILNKIFIENLEKVFSANFEKII